MLSIRNLAHQLFPRQSAYFLDAYRQACANPYGYLLGNMKFVVRNIYLPFSKFACKFQQHSTLENINIPRRRKYSIYSKKWLDVKQLDRG
jgi:hypothetical protein